LSMVRTLGILFQAEEESAKLIEKYQLQIKQLKEKGQKRKGSERLKVLYEVWTQPLTVAGQHNFFDASLKVLGLENAIDLNESWPQISLETIFSKEIDVVLCSSAVFCGDLRSKKVHPLWLKKNAVKFENLIDIDQRFNQPSPKLFEDLIWLDQLIDQINAKNTPPANSQNLEHEKE
jgi:ABC-type Fe3+-hydroxamate transport system substrate-binding protein